jgi:hypothetical protein
MRLNYIMRIFVSYASVTHEVILKMVKSLEILLLELLN